MIKIIIINGPAGVGKDTFVEYVRFALAKRNIASMNISTVDKIKQVFRMLGWDGTTKGAAERQFLSDLKDMSTKYNDGPSNYIRETIKEFSIALNRGVVFVHCREPEEISKLVSLIENATTVHVDRNVERFTNHADSKTIFYQYDHYISNVGTLDDLKTKAEQFSNLYLNI